MTRPCILSVVAACLAGGVLTGCSRPLLVEATAAIDATYEEIVAGPADDPGQPLDPSALLAVAQIKGPDFLRAQLDEADARLQLDDRKANRAARFALSLRRETALRDGGFALGAGDASVAMNWDIAAVLFSASDAESLQIAEDFLPVQAVLARTEATGRLFDAYFQHEDALTIKRGLQSDIRLANCQSDNALIELELGNISAAEMQLSRQIVAGLQAQSAVVDRSIQSLRREVLYRAGVAETARLAAGRNPVSAVATVPRNLSQEMCYVRSGNAVRDRLLLEGAVSALRLAQLQRFGRIDTLLPTAISPESGLNLSLLVSVLVPLVDQGDGEREVQSARRTLLALALAAEQNRRRFDVQLSEAEYARAQAITQLGAARSAVTLDSSDGPATCDISHAREQAQLELRRATIALQKAELALALLCAGTDTGASAGAGPLRPVLETAAPR